MKLKTPITDTRDLIELAFLVIEGAENAGIEKEYRKAARKALSLMIYAAENLHGEAEGSDCHGAYAPRNDQEGGGPPRASAHTDGKREVYPNIYAASNKPFLFSRLLDYAEWAECNEWEVPLCLADDLSAAAKFIRFMGEQHPDVCAHYEEAKKGADT